MSDLPPLAPLDGDLPDMTAGEFALGLLDGEDRAAAIRRVLAEPGFAREVEGWRVQLAHLFDLWPAMTAPEIFARIERSLDGAAPVGAVATLPPRSSARLWAGIAALSSIAAAGLLILLFTRPVPLPPPPPTPQARPSAPVAIAPTLVASITPTGKGAAVTALYDAHVGAIRLTGTTLAGAKRSAQLWVIPAGGTPHSLGLLSPHGGTALTLAGDNRARIVPGATLAISLEPIGGSPTGLPTGPVVATGALSHV